jgi:microcystin-dependent protein
MATVTGFTAEKMKTIENETVIDGEVRNDNLILVRRDGVEIDAGDVRGPPGPPGPGGTDVTGLMELLCPVGTVSTFAGQTVPQGWLLCDGASYLRTNYQALFDTINIAYGAADGTHFNVPNLADRFVRGLNASGIPLGSQGGSDDAIVVSHTHDHTHSIANAGQHSHPMDGDYGLRVGISAPTSTLHTTTDPGSGLTYTSIGQAGNHNHAIGQDATPAGSSGVGANLPKFLVMRCIIRY